LKKFLFLYIFFLISYENKTALRLMFSYYLGSIVFKDFKIIEKIGTGAFG